MSGPDLSDKPLMQYASDVAEGAGRTPVGIVMFAGSHLLLGGFLLWFGWPFAQHAWLGRKLDGEALFATIVLATAIPMLIGGGTLLCKGRSRWLASVAAHTLLALNESLLAAYGFALARWRFKHHDDKGILVGLIAGCVGVLLLLLCLVVLGYLASPKARKTFGLPPGESTAMFRHLPLFMLLVGLFIIALGLMISMQLK